MGQVQSWFWQSEGPWDNYPTRAADAAWVLGRRVPDEVVQLVREYVEFEGRLVDAVPFEGGRVDMMVGVGDHVVTMSRGLARTWSGGKLAKTIKLTEQTSCVTTLDSVLWVGTVSGTVKLYSAELYCLRFIVAHQVGVSALVVSSDGTKVTSYPLAPGDRVVQWSKEGIPLASLAFDSVKTILGVNMCFVHNERQGTISLYEEMSLVWEGPAQDVEGGPGLVSSFTTTMTNDFLETGATFIATWLPALNPRTIARPVDTEPSKVELVPRSLVSRDPPWAFPTRTTAAVDRYCVVANRLVLATSDNVMYFYQ